jgi:hypothetical protein
VYECRGSASLARGRLCARKHRRLEFAFGLEPIVQLTVRLFAALEIDFVSAASDVLVTRRFLY